MAFFGKDEAESLTLDRALLPQHVAIIMDGNGRWAQRRGMPRSFGHKAGVGASRHHQAFGSSGHQGADDLRVFYGKLEAFGGGSRCADGTSA